MVGDILQPTHLLFVLVVALLVLGPKRLPEVAKTLGNGLRDFRSALSGDSDHDEDEPPRNVLPPEESTTQAGTTAAPVPAHEPEAAPAPLHEPEATSVVAEPEPAKPQTPEPQPTVPSPAAPPAEGQPATPAPAALAPEPQAPEPAEAEPEPEPASPVAAPKPSS